MRRDFFRRVFPAYKKAAGLSGRERKCSSFLPLPTVIKSDRGG